MTTSVVTNLRKSQKMTISSNTETAILSLQRSSVVYSRNRQKAATLEEVRRSRRGNFESTASLCSASIPNQNMLNKKDCPNFTRILASTRAEMMVIWTNVRL